MKWYLISFLFLPLVSAGQLQLAKIFSDNMVLQRDEPVLIWGKAIPGDRVSISFGGENRFTIVPKDSSWSIYLKEQKANTRAQSIFISCGDKRIELKNILIGDVWLASGQSNMEWPMIREMHWKEEKKNANQPLIRLNSPVPAGRYVYGVVYKDSLNRRLTNDSFYLWDRWNVCDSHTVKDMSAVAYYFAKVIVEKENIPIGIINLSIGGAPIETFISKEALRSNEKFASKVSGNWLENESLPEWIRQRGKENVGNNANGFKDDLGLNHAYKPGFAYACGIEPLLAFSIKGIIWYQGESNSLEKERVEEYRALLQLMIADYRIKWKQPDMPFYWVQLSSIDTANYQSKLWPQFRDEQRKLLSEIKSGGMAVSSDIGLRNNVHPTNKKDVGERLARWALNRVYKENIIPSGPLPLQAEFEDGKILVSFQYARELKASDDKQILGFSLDGRTDVQVIVENNRVVIKSKEKPEYVYYGWRPFCDANLVNEEGLPASTFKIRVKYKEVSSQLPSLIPLPQQLQWKDGFFDLGRCKAIIVKNLSLKKEVAYLQTELKKKSFSIPVVENPGTNQPFIEIDIHSNDTISSKEAYRLRVDAQKISLTAKTTHGVFNGIQTLLQMIQNNKKLHACEIIDWPAFPWRSYMIDVGRNYMSMHLLKQQIDAMTRYKLNVFHFHPTEDIAWRFEIKQYPQLTASGNMLRNKGKFYSEKDIKELIAYCKERHIIFLPEIDMPGHSAAFRRAMNTDMQTDNGLIIVKNILKEICTTYDVPYIHIGADEVKITNQDFIPEVTRYIEGFEKKVIGWEPGGNFTNSTIRQLWMDDNAHRSSQNNIQFIDSRHLYLNHMDPLEAMVTIFNRKIGNREKGDPSLLGATLCMWNDRRVEEDIDILRMNPVYPGLLAFAERTWRGGGQTGWISNLSDGDVNAFTEFEDRLVDHQKRYFRNQPFPYVKQSQMHWQLYGPYDNDGDLMKKFPPEFSTDQNEWRLYKNSFGGTIVLRHWWYPLIKGSVEKPKENTTFYAFTKIWSDYEGEKNFWIGCNNLSRSPATDSPPVDAWDNKKSEVWVNEKRIDPPRWQHGGEKGDSEIPLIDEGYEYRKPTKILLKKGWNTVLLKLPAGSFRAKNWHNPVKWMFTFVPSASPEEKK